MALAAGKLRHRITIQARQAAQDPVTGEMLPAAWVDVWNKVPAAVEPRSAREYLAAQAGQAEATARITIRYREGLDATMRAIHRGKVYAFAGPPLPDKDSGREYLTILVSEGVSDG